MATVEQLMQLLQINEQEAQDVINYDREIDKGNNPLPLTKEQEKVAKSMRSAGKAPTVYKFTPRKRKEDSNKQFLIKLISDALQAVDKDLEIVNPERELNFQFQGKQYKITLSCPRK